MAKEPQELYNEISSFVNGARPDKIKELAQLLSNDHPTLQQLTMSLCLQFIKAMAEKPYVDARNIESKLHAQAALEGIYKMWVQKFVDSGMTQEDAEAQAKACIENPSLSFI